MDNIKTQYKFEPKFQIALKDFLNNIDNVYYELDLKFTNDEAIKIKEIQRKRDGK